MKKLSESTVVITGGGKNIGREIALRFAKEGANIVILDYNADCAEKIAQEIEAIGAMVEIGVADVRDYNKVSSVINNAAKRFGTIDILVNNAGGSAALIGKLTRFANAEKETLDFVIDTNLKGAMYCTQTVLPYMIKNKLGKIINISSIAAVCGLYDRVDYSAAKAGLIGMTKALAMEVGIYNICVNCVSPGAIARDGVVNEHMTYLGETGRGGLPQDIAQAVLFLAAQDYITGQNLIVDGGRTLGPGHI